MDIKSINKIKDIISILLLLILFCYSCQQSSEGDKLKVNFSNKEDIYDLTDQTGRPLRAAVAAMISPEENFFYYSRIFDYISQKIERRIIFKQRKSYHEVNELLRLQELDFAFICSGGYIEAKEDFDAEILAIPQIKGKTHYYAFIIVRNDLKIEKFEDLEELSFAFTDPLSNTGCLYPRYLVRRMNQSEEEFFSHIIYTHAHDYSVQAVANKLVDGASVHSIIFNYMKMNTPHKVAKLKVIKKSGPFGMPPVVINPKIDPNLKRELQEVLFNMSSDPQGKEVLSRLAIDCFVPGQDRDYDSVREMKAFIQVKSHEGQNSTP